MHLVRCALAAAAALLNGLIIAPVARGTQPEAVPVFTAFHAGESADIVIDGELTESAWEQATLVDEFHTYWPRTGVPAPVRTWVRLVRDAKSFYVAARMFDPEISQLRAGLARRDSFSNEQDWFSIAIDPVGSRRVAQLFYFNAHGVIWDGLSNEDSGNSSSSADFDVEAATRVDSESWILELRIPFRELRYPSGDPGNWHILLRRNYPRGQRYAMSAPAIPTRPPCTMCMAAPLVSIGELPAPSSISAVPQVVSLGRGEGDDMNDLDWHSRIEPGLEIKYRMSASTVLDATLNPDFSQVELDTPQLSSNEQFAVSFPEKRPFFLEGLDILDSPLQAIYTRSITDPAWGARATHRGTWDGVWLTTQDDGGGFVVIPSTLTTAFVPQTFSSQATIGRFRVPVGRTTFGALLTDRRGEHGHNTVSGADFAWRLASNARVRAQWLTSRTRATDDFPSLQPGDPSAFNGDALSLDWLYENPRWRSEVVLERLDETFRADNGFIPQTGVRRAAGELRYKLLNLPITSELASYISTDVREDLAGNKVRDTPRFGIAAAFSRNTLLEAEWRPQERFRVRAGSPMREAHQGYISLTSNPGSQIPIVTLSAIFGDAVDFFADRVGNGETLSASVLFRPIQRLEIEPRWDSTSVRTRADFVLPAQSGTETAAQLLATLHLTARDRVRLIVQHLTFDRDEPNGSGLLLESNTLLGSLLFTHERSLATRFYAGVSFARDSGISAQRPTDAFEIFVKMQMGFSGDGDLSRFGFSRREAPRTVTSPRGLRYHEVEALTRSNR